MSEYDAEPIPGLPDYLPEGETLLWQGAPSTGEIARRALHTGLVAVYFALLLSWRVLAGIYDGATPAEIAVNSVPLLITASAALGLLYLIAYFIARTTIYSITSRRIVMRFGVALPIAVNVPYSSVKKADVVTRPSGAGDVVLSVEGLGRLGYLHLWPHVRGWHVRKPQPVLRGLANVSEPATVLARALHAASGQPGRAIVPEAPARPSSANSAVEPAAHAAA